MTDQQYQPGQTNPPTQGGGVFGGTAEEISHPISLNDLQNKGQISPVVVPVQTPVTNPAPVQAPVINPAPVQAPVINPAPVQVPVTNPAPVQAPVTNPAPVQAPVTNPAPVQAPVTNPAPVQAPVTNPAPEQSANQQTQATVHKEGKDDLQIGVRDEGQDLPEIPLSTYDGFLFPKPVSKAELQARAAAKENMLSDKEDETPSPEIKPGVVQVPAAVIQAPAAVVAETKNDIISPTPQHIPHVPEHNEPQHPGEKLSDVQQKFSTLLQLISELTTLLNIKDGVVEVVGANNDKVSVSYQFEINDKKQIFVKKVESDKEDDNKTVFNELKLLVNPESKFFEIYLDDMMLFEEPELHDTKKKFQVMEKLNKLVFLAEGKLKDIQKELRAKQEELEERKKLQDIFRNF